MQTNPLRAAGRAFRERESGRLNQHMRLPGQVAAQFRAQSREFVITPAARKITASSSTPTRQ